MTINGLYIPGVKTEEEFWAARRKFIEEEKERAKTYKPTQDDTLNLFDLIQSGTLTAELNTSDTAFKYGRDYDEYVANKI